MIHYLLLWGPGIRISIVTGTSYKLFTKPYLRRSSDKWADPTVIILKHKWEFPRACFKESAFISRSTNVAHSVATLEAKANVCCVKFNPTRYMKNIDFLLFENFGRLS